MITLQQSKRVWLLEEGDYYDERAFFSVVYKTKKKAVINCKEEGFFYKRKTDYWEKEATQRWRHIRTIEFLT